MYADPPASREPGWYADIASSDGRMVYWNGDDWTEEKFDDRQAARRYRVPYRIAAPVLLAATVLLLVAAWIVDFCDHATFVAVVLVAGLVTGTVAASYPTDTKTRAVYVPLSLGLLVILALSGLVLMTFGAMCQLS